MSKLRIILIFATVMFVSSNVLEFLEDQHKPPLFVGDSLHEYLHDMDKEGLKSLALALDEYHRQVKHLDKSDSPFIDHIDELSVEFIREFISKEVNEHPEINRIDQIEEIVKNFEESKEILTYLATLNRDDLMRLALLTERIHRDSLGIGRLIGGLHDYVWSLDNNQIKDIIIKESKEHEILSTVTYLKRLVGGESIYLFKLLEFPDLLKQSEFKKGIQGIINESSKTRLLALLKYLVNEYAKDRKIEIQYDSLNEKNIKEMINFMIKEHEEKLDYKRLEEILKEK